MSVAIRVFVVAALVAVVFGIARTIAALVSGNAIPEPVATFVVEAAAGIFVGLSAAVLVMHVSGGRARATAVLTWLVFANLAAVMIEGAAFQPEAVPLPGLPASLFMQLVVASLVAVTAIQLTAREAVGPAPTAPPRSVLAWSVRYAACVLVYVVLYFVTGALNFMFVTGPYYASHVAGLVVPDPAIVLLVAVVEGALFPIAIVPLCYSLSTSRRTRTMLAGASLLVLGGIVPLIVAPSLPLGLRIASVFEIALQKFPAGAAAAVLLGPKD
jgi:hypothetical protein